MPNGDQNLADEGQTVAMRDDGEMARLIRDYDWSTSPLGAAETWSPALRMMVGLLTANRFPMLLWWGPEYISIYNDAYRPVLGTKHPGALGKPFRDVWPEVAHVLSPLIDKPFHGGPSSWTDDIQLEVKRHGFLEEAHFAFAYSPVPDETAPRGIGGVLASVYEITEKIVGERHIAILRDLGASTGEARTGEDACRIMGEALGRHAFDVPFALFYLVDEDAKQARLAGATGVVAGQSVAVDAIPLTGEEAAWPLAEVLASQQPVVVERLGARFATVPAGPWSDPPDRAIVLPIRSTAPRNLAGFLVAGISARLALTDLYRGFLDLAAAQIGTVIANARAHEEEHRRSEALAAIDRAKTAFFSNISHEFRTPLTLMLGPLEDAIADQGEPLGARQRERIEMAGRNGLRLQKLVNSLLDFSRVQAGRAQAFYQPTDLPALTRDLASNFRAACESAGLALMVETPPLGHDVFVDREMWEKIVLNLISNAFKFTFEGSIRVGLAAGDDAAILTVADTGTGIPAAELSKIFERFHRIAGARGRTHEGTGIGLALVQELVHLHQGEISVVSELGVGTTFTVRIPLGRAHLPAEHVDTSPRTASTAVGAPAFLAEASRWLRGAASHEIGGTPAPEGAARPVILVVDDNADMRDYLMQLLGRHYEVRAVENGEAALASIRRELPDLVLSDVMMPGMDGHQLARMLKADPGLAELPVILLSARAGEDATVEGLYTGADEYLTKPFSARELLARLAAALERAQGRRLIRESEQRFRALVTATADVVYRMSADWREMRTLHGRGFLVDTESPSIAWLDEYLFPEDQPQILAAIDAAIAAKGVFQLEHRVRRTDGSVGWTFSRAVPVLDGQGGIVEWFGAATDITERRQLDQHLQLVVNELNHRVKNNLAMIQGIAYQTFRTSATMIQAEDSFSGRLMALAQANDLMIGDRGVSVGLGSVLEQALEPHRPGPGRCRIAGPAATLTTKSALALSMAMHELATNAVKYGAWSNDTGRVELTWTRRPGADGADRLHLAWQEIGGPPVAPPRHRGFGSRLIERGLAAELAGTVELRFEPTGLVCIVDAPLPAASDAAAD